jgi:hypothetical protein
VDILQNATDRGLKPWPCPPQAPTACPPSYAVSDNSGLDTALVTITGGGCNATVRLAAGNYRLQREHIIR